MATPASDIRLLLSDVDGTLVTRDKVLLPSTLAAARALREAGIGLALTSARPPSGVRMLIEPLDLRMPIAGFNGGLIVDPDFTVLESYSIPPKAAAATVEMMAQGGLDIWVYTENDWCICDPAGLRVDREAFIIQAKPRVMETFTPEVLDRAFKIVGVSADHPRVAAVEATVQATLGDAVNATRSTDYFLDVTHPMASKGQVVHFLAGKLGLATTQIATIGDMFNDVSMFRESGLSIAMGNAAEEVKAQASFVTDSNEDGGWGKAVDRYLLGRGG